MNSAQATINGTRTDHDAFVSPVLSDSVIAAEPLDHPVPANLVSGSQIFCDIGHMAKISFVGLRQKRRACIAALLAALVLFAACSGLTVAESSDQAVTVRYGAAEGLDGANELAQKACAAHHKTARLRNIANFGLTDRYAHFDCV